MSKPENRSEKLFKACTMCKKVWVSREQFLADPEIELIGYQVDFRNLELGLFLFNHRCKTTIAIQANHFTDLYSGPVFEKNLYGTENCPEYCLYTENLKSCKEFCECRYVRETLQLIKSWPKRKNP